MDSDTSFKISKETLILKLENPAATLELVGGKGASLARLAAAGLPVPSGFHITTYAYRRFIDENRLTESILSAARQAQAEDSATLDNTSAQIHALIMQGAIPDDIATLIRQSYAELGWDDPAVAVRSSATSEDLPEMSFAGQQETYLNIRGSGTVLDAVKRCWASLWTARAIGYRIRNNVSPKDVALAVIVQQLIPADVAGILFTANPITGARDQILINAAWGLGEAIVGGHVTPDTFIVNKQTNTLDAQEIADKEMMTVCSPGGTHEGPVPSEKRKQATLTRSQAIALSQLGMQIEQLYEQPMDIEWALQDGRFFILQARPITALPEARVSLDWKLPQAKGKYIRQNVIELLPDPLSPLFATLGLSAWNNAMHQLGKSIGLDLPDFMPEKALLTINDYAYLDAGLIAEQSAHYLLAIPRLVKAFRTAQERWAEEARPRYVAVVARWAECDFKVTSATQLLTGTREIMRVAAEHYLTIQSGILPMSKLSETLFPLVYNRLIKRRDDPPALTFMLGFDSAPIQAEKSLYDLAMWARGHSELANYLIYATSVEVASAYQSSSAPIVDAESWREFSHQFREHLDRFGHVIFNLDFAKSVPSDDPPPLLETLKYFLRGQGHNPHERQAETVSAREQATLSMLRRLKGFRLRWFTRLLRWVQLYGPLRENALADVGWGWPILRRMLREIGRRLADAHAIADPYDVFWLQMNELEEAAHALDANQSIQDFYSLVTERRARWERERMVTPPVNLPIKGGARFWGIDWSFTSPARTDQAAGKAIKGIGASPGRVDGIARVIHGPNEFNQMRDGDILVAKITTPAWTPLFALASGVVTDVGGILSHSSIVAREYHIPAVLGTGVAMERIYSGQRITVDGDSGVVTIELTGPPGTLDWQVPRRKGNYMRSSVIELLPDPLTPLFATLGLPAWNEAMRDLGKSAGLELSDFMPEQILLTINDYAYYDFGFSTKQSLRFLLLMPRLIKSLLPTAQQRWEGEARPRYRDVVRTWAARDLNTTSATELLHGAREIVRMTAEHYLTIQSGIIPVAGGSESLFTLFYSWLIKRKNDPPALTFMLGFDSAPLQAEKSLYDLAMWARAQSDLANYLTSAKSIEIAAAYKSSFKPIASTESWNEFSRRFEEHLNRFGHTIYDLDFAKSVPADDPAPLLETLKFFLSGQGRNPYERQAETVSAREQATQSTLARLKGLRRRWFTRLLEWAQRYAPLREDALADVGLGWPLLRRMLQEIGRRLTQVEIIGKPDDVFWLKVDELEQAAKALDTNEPMQDFHHALAERRATWERERRVTPPVVLPVKGGGRLWGINWTSWMSARTDQAAGDTIKGIGASPGRVTGIARVIHDPGEFNQMQPNDILVAKITTPAWTPLFALAAAVVTDVGGILSHSSIVAREYHIPAVLGTGVATERIHSGQWIMVDGDEGVVTIER